MRKEIGKESLKGSTIYQSGGGPCYMCVVTDNPIAQPLPTNGLREETVKTSIYPTAVMVSPSLYSYDILMV